MAVRDLGCPTLSGVPTEADKGKGVSVCVVWRRRGTVREPGIKHIGAVKKTEAPTLAKQSLPTKGMGQVGTPRKEWVRGTPKDTAQWWVW